MRVEHFVKIDSHAHLTSDEMYSDVDDGIMRAKESNVTKIINICTDQVTLERGIKLAEKYPGIVYNTGSTTPHDVEREGEKYFQNFEDAAKSGKLVAVGETGLDYYYEHSNSNLQKEFLRRYLVLASQTNLPVVFHCRGDEAFDDLFQITKEYPELRAVLHCFTGTLEQAKEALSRRWYISMSGIVTFKRSRELRDVMKEIPLESLFIETDSPYLAPQTRRGKRNEPSFVGEVAEMIAEGRGISLEEVCKVTSSNISKFFAI